MQILSLTLPRPRPIQSSHSLLIGSPVFAAFFTALASLPPASNSSYSCAIIALMRSHVKSGKRTWVGSHHNALVMTAEKCGDTPTGDRSISGTNQMTRRNAPGFS